MKQQVSEKQCWKSLKELGVSKDVVKYHQRKMNSNESFKANGKIYITPAGVEKIKNSLRKDKEFYSVTFE